MAIADKNMDRMDKRRFLIAFYDRGMLRTMLMDGRSAKEVKTEFIKDHPEYTFSGVYEKVSDE